MQKNHSKFYLLGTWAPGPPQCLPSRHCQNEHQTQSQVRMPSVVWERRQHRWSYVHQVVLNCAAQQLHHWVSTGVPEPARNIQNKDFKASKCSGYPWSKKKLKRVCHTLGTTPWLPQHDARSSDEFQTSFQTVGQTSISLKSVWNRKA